MMLNKDPEYLRLLEEMESKQAELNRLRVFRDKASSDNPYGGMGLEEDIAKAREDAFCSAQAFHAYANKAIMLIARDLYR